MLCRLAESSRLFIALAKRSIGTCSLAHYIHQYPATGPRRAGSRRFWPRLRKSTVAISSSQMTPYGPMLIQAPKRGY